MRPINGAAQSLTDAQIVALIKTDPAIKVGKGMELLDRSLAVQEDISDSLRTCTVTRDNSATLHASSSFTLARRMSWENAVVRPYVTISNGTNTARFNMGAYFTSSPLTVTDEVPATYTVTGIDILNALNTLVGDSFSINVGDAYLTVVDSILSNLGYSSYIIDPARASTTAPVAKGWPLDATTTWLQIVNELLAAVGYDNIYSDWDGRLICQSLRDITQRHVEWAYTRGTFDGQLVPRQQVTHDYFATPNRWVGIQGSTDTTNTPTEGNGVFTYVNQNAGETSVNARGQTITAVLTPTVADQAALVAAVMAQVAIDMNVGTTINATTSVSPLHWHRDVVSVETLEFGVLVMQQMTWSMDLTNGAMTHVWSKI